MWSTETSHSEKFMTLCSTNYYYSTGWQSVQNWFAAEVCSWHIAQDLFTCWAFYVVSFESFEYCSKVTNLYYMTASFSEWLRRSSSFLAYPSLEHCHLLNMLPVVSVLWLSFRLCWVWNSAGVGQNPLFMSIFDEVISSNLLEGPVIISWGAVT